MRTSARNHFVGHIAEINHGAAGDEVVLRTPGGIDIHALLTSGTARSLGLSRNSEAFALVRATSVIVLVDFDNSKVSARNCVVGKVAFVERGPSNAEVCVAAPGGAQVVSFITNDGVDRLGLSPGKPATAVFKATSVIIGVESP
ncbi:TOBE domain-containing protein [Caballeronia ptereochthonis]|uniref:TOBE domain-containing protein n=1 Tax=Caballeronia ptereochthonis TaxID=1777144 RepID=UPI000AFB331F|nr:TOBE domain-containing protein [Caballeronia ptereochthonis]